MASSTAARPKGDSQPNATQAQQVHTPAEQYRTEIIQAITRLNEQADGLYWWGPTDIQHELEQIRLDDLIAQRKRRLHRQLRPDEIEALRPLARMKRSTVGMRLMYMRDEKSVAFEAVEDTGATGGASGYRYGIEGTPPSGEQVQPAANSRRQLARLALENAQMAAQRALDARPPRRERPRHAPGRRVISATVDADLWQEVRERALATGATKERMMEHVLRTFLACEPVPPRSPAERVSNYLPGTRVAVSA